MLAATPGIGGWDLKLARGLIIGCCPNRDLLYLGIESSFREGIQCDSLFQLNFVARQITGATKSLLSMLADAVL